MLSAEKQARKQALRMKAITNTWTEEEKVEAVALIREDRMSAQIASTTSKAKKAAAAPISGDDLLSDALADD